MKIRLITGANVPDKNAKGGSVQRKPGWTGDVSDKFGRSLIEMGRAVVVGTGRKVEKPESGIKQQMSER